MMTQNALSANLWTVLHFGDRVLHFGELIDPTGRALLQRDLNKKHYRVKAKDGVSHDSPSILKMD